MKADSIVKARIPTEIKDRVFLTLEQMGLTVSDLIRLTLLRVAEEGRLPFDVAIPNATTRKAMAELEEGKGTRFTNSEALFKDLEI
jgi:DNA-damage-inducible protein J